LVRAAFIVWRSDASEEVSEGAGLRRPRRAGEGSGCNKRHDMLRGLSCCLRQTDPGESEGSPTDLHQFE